MKMVAKVQYIIEPSRLNEYPSGSTNEDTRLLQPKRSSCASVFGYAASLEAVANASSVGSCTARKRPTARPRSAA